MYYLVNQDNYFHFDTFGCCDVVFFIRVVSKLLGLRLLSFMEGQDERHIVCEEITSFATQKSNFISNEE